MVQVEVHALQLLITQKELWKECLLHYGKLLVTRNYHTKNWKTVSILVLKIIHHPKRETTVINTHRPPPL